MLKKSRHEILNEITLKISSRKLFNLKTHLTSLKLNLILLNVKY